MGRSDEERGPRMGIGAKPWIEHWDPEDDAFWEPRGRSVARPMSVESEPAFAGAGVTPGVGNRYEIVQ